MKTLLNAIKGGITSYLNVKENQLIGGVLFSEATNGQILLFNKFGVCAQNNLSLKSDITNHYTEENYWINDHWAISAPQYTLTGLIGEVIYTVPEGWAEKIETLYSATGLGLLSVLSPKLGSYTSSILNITRKVESVVQKYTNYAYNAVKQVGNFLTKNSYGKTNQRKVLDELESLMNNRTLCTVYTPYGTYKNLAIIAINVRQGQETKFISDIEITFQKWRNVGEFFDKDINKKSQTDLVDSQKSTVKEMGLIGCIKSELSPNDLGTNFQVA